MRMLRMAMRTMMMMIMRMMMTMIMRTMMRMMTMTILIEDGVVVVAVVVDGDDDDDKGAHEIGSDAARRPVANAWDKNYRPGQH